MIFVGHVGKQSVVLSCATSWGLSELRHLYFVVLLHARVAGLPAWGPVSTASLRLLGLWLGWWPSLEEGPLGAHLSPRGQQCGQVSALGGSGPHCAPLGLEMAGEAPGHQPVRGSLCRSALLTAPVFPETGIRPVGLAWDLPQRCRSCPSKCRGTRAMCFMPRGEKGDAEAALV